MLQDSFRKVPCKPGVFKLFFAWKHNASVALNMVRAFILIISFCPVLSSCSGSEPSWFADLEQARHLCASGNLGESEALLLKAQKASAKTGHCPPPYFSVGQSGRTAVTYSGELAALADCYAFRGRAAEAQALLSNAINSAKNDPKNANVLAPMRALASIYESKKKYALAEPVRISITSLPHASLEDSYRLGDLYLAENKMTEAESIYIKALAIEEKQEVRSAQMSDHLNKLGRCYFLQGNLDQAEKLYKRALEYDPLAHESDRGDSFNAKDLRPMAELYCAKGELPKAEAFYRQSLSGALEYTPGEQVQILTDYARLLRTMKRVSEAEIREGQARNKSLEAASAPHEYVQRSYE
jgi:tetratricopeptide (TPR) repeat protein